MSEKVNTFIIGAPKSGTTALSEYLNYHKDVFVPPIKEPHFFCDDFNDFRRVTNINEYDSLFNKSNEKIKIDASVWYLYSKVAIRKILEYNKESKVIIMIRNPLTMLPSLHNQLVFSGREDVESFDLAWSLSGDRRKGMNVPENVKEISHLYYDDVCSYYEQICRVKSFFNRKSIKIIVFDEFIKSPEKVLNDVLVFLDIEKMEYNELPKVNASRQHRYPRLSRFLISPPYPLNIIKSFLKKNKYIKGRPMLRRLYGLMSKPKSIEKPLSSCSQDIQRCYSEDVRNLESAGIIRLGQWF